MKFFILGKTKRAIRAIIERLRIPTMITYMKYELVV